MKLHVVEEDGCGEGKHSRSGDEEATNGAESRPRKHLRCTNGSESHTMRGLTAGLLRVNFGQVTRKKQCVIVGDLFPAWVLHLPAMGFEIEHILLKDPKYVALLRSLCGLVVPIWSGTAWERLVALWPKLKEGVVAFVDGRAGEGLLSLMAGVGIGEVYS
jgi:hypothetical protein